MIDYAGGTNPPWEEKPQNGERELQRFSAYQDCRGGDDADADDESFRGWYIPHLQVGTIHSNIEHLNSKLAEAQEAKQDLLAIKHKLEQVMMVDVDVDSDDEQG